MDVPEEMTIKAFFPGSFSVASLFISPHPNTMHVGMYKLNTGFVFIMLNV